MPPNSIQDLPCATHCSCRLRGVRACVHACVRVCWYVRALVCADGWPSLPHDVDQVSGLMWPCGHGAHTRTNARMHAQARACASARVRTCVCVSACRACTPGGHTPIPRQRTPASLVRMSAQLYCRPSRTVGACCRLRPHLGHILKCLIGCPCRSFVLCDGGAIGS